MTSRRPGWRGMPVTAAALGGTVTAGTVALVAVTRRPGRAAAAAPQVSTAAVVRTNLATTMLTAGTLGYAATRPLINQLNGTYTLLPGPGRASGPATPCTRWTTCR